MTVTVTRGFTIVPNVPLSIDDWHALGTPIVTVDGDADIGDGTILPEMLHATVFGGLTAETALAASDRLPFYDASAAANRYILVSNALNGVFSLAPVATAFTSYSADVMTFHNGTAAATMTVARAAENLVAQAPSLSTTADADEVLVHDASAAAGSRAARATLANLLPDKVTAGTYVFPASLTVDAKGRITAIVAGAGQTQAGSDEDIPVAGADVSFTWTAGAPKRIDVFYVCQATSSYWLAGDMVTGDSMRCYDPTGNPFQGMLVYYEPATSKIRITRASNADNLKYALPKGQGGTPEVLDESKWKLRVYASV